jgi:hypothetical protein
MIRLVGPATELADRVRRTTNRASVEYRSSITPVSIIRQRTTTHFGIGGFFFTFGGISAETVEKRGGTFSPVTARISVRHSLPPVYIKIDRRKEPLSSLADRNSDWRELGGSPPRFGRLPDQSGNINIGVPQIASSVIN